MEEQIQPTSLDDNDLEQVGNALDIFTNVMESTMRGSTQSQEQVQRIYCKSRESLEAELEAAEALNVKLKHAKEANHSTLERIEKEETTLREIRSELPAVNKFLAKYDHITTSEVHLKTLALVRSALRKHPEWIPSLDEIVGTSVESMRNSLGEFNQFRKKLLQNVQGAEATLTKLNTDFSSMREEQASIETEVEALRSLKTEHSERMQLFEETYRSAIADSFLLRREYEEYKSSVEAYRDYNRKVRRDLKKETQDMRTLLVESERELQKSFEDQQASCEARYKQIIKEKDDELINVVRALKNIQREHNALTVAKFELKRLTLSSKAQEDDFKREKDRLHCIIDLLQESAQSLRQEIESQKSANVILKNNSNEEKCESREVIDKLQQIVDSLRHELESQKSANVVLKDSFDDETCEMGEAIGRLQINVDSLERGLKVQIDTNTILENNFKGQEVKLHGMADELRDVRADNEERALFISQQMKEIEQYERTLYRKRESIDSLTRNQEALNVALSNSRRECEQAQIRAKKAEEDRQTLVESKNHEITQLSADLKASREQTSSLMEIVGHAYRLMPGSEELDLRKLQEAWFMTKSFAPIAEACVHPATEIVTVHGMMHHADAVIPARDQAWALLIKLCCKEVEIRDFDVRGLGNTLGQCEPGVLADCIAVLWTSVEMMSNQLPSCLSDKFMLCQCLQLLWSCLPDTSSVERFESIYQKIVPCLRSGSLLLEVFTKFLDRLSEGESCTFAETLIAAGQSQRSLLETDGINLVVDEPNVIVVDTYGNIGWVEPHQFEIRVNIPAGSALNFAGIPLLGDWTTSYIDVTPSTVPFLVKIRKCKPFCP